MAGLACLLGLLFLTLFVLHLFAAGESFLSKVTVLHLSSTILALVAYRLARSRQMKPYAIVTTMLLCMGLSLWRQLPLVVALVSLAGLSIATGCLVRWLTSRSVEYRDKSIGWYFHIGSFCLFLTVTIACVCFLERCCNTGVDMSGQSHQWLMAVMPAAASHILFTAFMIAYGVIVPPDRV